MKYAAHMAFQQMFQGTALQAPFSIPGNTDSPLHIKVKIPAMCAADGEQKQPPQQLIKGHLETPFNTDGTFHFFNALEIAWEIKFSESQQSGMSVAFPWDFVIYIYDIVFKLTR